MALEHPDIVHPKYRDLEVDRYPCRCVMGGTRTMREARTDFLPQEPQEQAADYENRLQRSFLYNGLKKTVVTFAGKVFDRPIQIKGNEALEEWSQDVTLEGRDATAFARDLWYTGVAEGMAFILVDYPQNEGAESYADEKRKRLRPFMVDIQPVDVIWWSVEYFDGVLAVSDVRFRETYWNSEGKEVKRIRRIYRDQSGVNFEVYETDKDGKWGLFSAGPMRGINRVPVVPIYFNERIGIYQSKPPLKDLADLNIQHWQSASDQRHILHVARVPVLFVKCMELQGDKIVIGVNRALVAENENADAKYIAAPAEPINAGKEDLQEIERRMDAMGVQLMLARVPGTSETATGRAIDKSQEQSALQFMVGQMHNGLVEATRLMCEWENMPVNPEVEMNTSFDLVPFDNDEMAELAKARERGDISRETWWEEAMRRSMLRPDFDMEVEAERLAKEERDATIRGLEAMKAMSGAASSETEDEESEETE